MSKLTPTPTMSDPSRFGRHVAWLSYATFAILLAVVVDDVVRTGDANPFWSHLKFVAFIGFSVACAFVMALRQSSTLAGPLLSLTFWVLFVLALALNVPNLMAGLIFLAASAITSIFPKQQGVATPAAPNHQGEKARAQQPLIGVDDEEGAEEALPVFNYPAEPSKTTFAEVVGMNKTKAEMKAALDCALNEQDGRNGILLFGKPGNGKTMLANALAGEADLPIISVAFGDFASRWINQTSEQVVQLFKEARAQAPCVLFMDEIDSLIIDRSAVSSSESEAPKITNLLLTELVNTRGTGVLIVAATNYLDRLDTAAVRAGRFDFKIEIPSPDLAARRAILAETLRKDSLKRGFGSMVSGPETLDRISRRWDGFSCATLSAIAKAVVDIGKQKQAKTIDFSLWMAALRTVQGDVRRLPEGTPTIEELVCNAPLRDALHALSMRLMKIEQLEDLGGSVPTGVLFYGPPGTGKTLTTRALAKSSGWAFLPTSGNALLRDPTVIDDLLEKASNLRPCIVFIDEADDALADRGHSPHTTTITNKLLSAIDGADGKIPDVVFVAATNNPHMMDSAALRGGRFTEKIGFELPNQETMLGLIQMWQKKNKIHDLGHLHDQMAAALDGQSPANAMSVLQACLNEIAIRHVSGDRSAPNWEDFQRGYVRVLGN